jgi:hypothetical protein
MAIYPLFAPKGNLHEYSLDFLPQTDKILSRFHLNIDPASLHRSLKDGSNIKLERVKKLLDYLGYKIHYRRGKHKSVGGGYGASQ